jgi:hypothetical protein
MKEIKKYDSRLFLKKRLDGSTDVLRKSKFEKWKDFTIFTITNQLVGNWVIEKLRSMDSQRLNFINEIASKNLKIRNKRSDDRQHRDVADFIRNWEQFII